MYLQILDYTIDTMLMLFEI